MSEPSKIMAAICGGCCFVISSTSNTLCSLRPLGFHKACCSDQGYFGCCCGDSFDEEHFDKQMKREMERTRDKTLCPLIRPVETVPKSTDSMTVEARELEPEDDVDHVEVGPS